jgi:hypothetical protein
MNLRRLALAGVILFGAARASAQLAVRSPFLPAEAVTAAAATPSVLEFFGYIDTANGPQFRINDTARKTGAWVRLNRPDPDLGLVAKRHDVAGDFLVVEHQGQSLTLPLRQSKIKGVPKIGLPLPNVTTAAVDRTLRPAAVDSMSDAQKQLESLAASIAQRRALRTQPASSAPTPAVTPAPAANRSF